MNTEDKLRIEKEARDYALTRGYAGGVQIKWCEKDYIAGATAEHELLKPQLEYADNYIQMVTEDRDKLAKQLKQERNKVIDECKDILKNQTTDCSRVITVNDLLNEFESLKLKSE